MPIVSVGVLRTGAQFNYGLVLFRADFLAKSTFLQLYSLPFFIHTLFFLCEPSSFNSFLGFKLPRVGATCLSMK